MVFETILSTNSNTPAPECMVLGSFPSPNPKEPGIAHSFGYGRQPFSTLPGVGVSIRPVTRVERRLFAIADELNELAAEEHAVEEELEMHRHIAEDAVRDSVVSGGDFDRLEAGLAEADVRRFERRLADIERRRVKLERDRARLLTKLGD